MQLRAGQNKQTVEHTNLLLRHQGELSTSAHLLRQDTLPLYLNMLELNHLLKRQSDNTVHHGSAYHTYT